MPAGALTVYDLTEALEAEEDAEGSREEGSAGQRSACPVPPGEKGRQKQQPGRIKHSLGHRLLHQSKAEGKPTKLAQAEEEKRQAAEGAEGMRP